MNGKEILAVRMQSNDARAETIQDYLISLAEEVWFEEEGFSGKRPFGNSGWQGEVILSLVVAGAIPGKVEEWDKDCYDLTCYNQDDADQAISKALDALRYK